MALAPGSRLGPYDILSAIGAGGMGEVYKARDTRLGRTVAIKILSEALAADPQFRARFDREAHAISQLTDPHICRLYDIGENQGTAFLVMEYLEGETLASRLSRATGPLATDEALRIATDIAGALDQAHRAGITHRDLKPANVMLTKSGATLLDFGVAKLRETTAPLSMSGVTRLATPTPQTAQGSILGTVHYMSPEQVEGRDIDPRADIWALGVVLYEMLTGSRPFDGGSAASVISAIMKDTPPPVTMRQPLAPPLIDYVVARCLEKAADDRWQTAADLHSVLRVLSGRPASSRLQATGSPAWPTRIGSAIAIGAILFALGIGAGWRYAAAPSRTAPLVQFDVLPPADAMLSPAPVAYAAQLALSADGRRIAFVALKRRGASQIYVRSFGERDARALPGTDGASYPFWSPDGRYIGFFAARKLRKVNVDVGGVEDLCDAPAGRGATWNADGIILFAPTPNSPLSRIAASGGTPVVATVLDRTIERAIGHNWPQFLPDGRHFLYHELAANPDYEGVHVGELGSTSGAPRVLAIQGLALYTSGYLTFVRDGVAFAQPFDVRSLRTSGDAVRIADRVGYFTGAFGYSAIAASPADAFAFGPQAATMTSLQWVTRSGLPAGHIGTPNVYTSPRLSIDQKRVVVAITGATMAERNIWVVDVARDAVSRATFDPAADWFPACSPTGDRIYFGSTRLGLTTMYQKVGVIDETPLDNAPPTISTYPSDVSSDGRLIAYVQSTARGYDIGVMTVADHTTAPFLSTPFNEIQPRFSPNGRYIAYASDESGQFEVYVRKYPTGTAEWKISLAGGTQPEWRRDGRDLFYISSDGKMTAVPVVTDDGDFQAGTPRVLFDVDVPEPSAPYPGHYAVTADGERFLVNTVIDQPNRPSLTIMLNWTAALKKTP